MDKDMRFIDIKREYADKCRKYIERHISSIFRCRQEFHHFNHILSTEYCEAGSTDLIVGAYGKITGFKEDGEPLVRLLSLEKLANFGFFTGKSDYAVTVNLRNWTGYTYESIAEILDDFVEDESKLSDFILDSFYKDDTDMTSGKWKITMDDFNNNIRPWVKKL